MPRSGPRRLLALAPEVRGVPRAMVSRMVLGFRAWWWIAAFGGALACNLETSGQGGGDTASVDPTDPSTTGGSSTGTTGAPPGSSTGGVDTTAASTSGPSGTDGSTTASADTADTEEPPTVIMRCNDEDFTIPDFDSTGVTSPIELTVDGTIVELRVGIQATHTWVGDLAFELRQGEAVLMVMERPLGCNGNDIDMVLHDDALDTIDESCHDDGRGTPALSGELLPAMPLDPVFGSLPVAGTWRLRAIDGNIEDEGMLTGWCLQITYR
jgi:hypothetical protein